MYTIAKVEIKTTIVKAKTTTTTRVTSEVETEENSRVAQIIQSPLV